MSERRGFRLGFGLSGLLSAGIAYLAFDRGFFSGPPWVGFLTACGIGLFSALSTVLLEKAAFRVPARAGAAGEVPIRGGDWGCPRCGSAYVREAKTCTDCQVALVEAGPRG